MAKVKWPKLPRYLIPLFQCANVYLCRSREEWHQACAALGCDGDDISMLGGATRQYQNIELQENLYLLGVFNGDIATLVHECAHVAFYVCRDTGVTINLDDANETYCYLLDKLFSHFLPHIEAMKDKPE
ncbi:hypothetical protein J8631_09915 [Serratia fonticola]|uniref:hypothetical protein n=1 Tax=Serratia fonticola TaxID=47917 RepID=UPI001AE1B280|nr:hypothetical protein [Serratia fonticola]MBP1035875.1 hypothetical protein [Serratia fonticola]